MRALFFADAAVSFNFVAASFIHEPGYLDDAYYFGGALRLAQGHGLSEPYLWNYLGSPTTLPLVGPLLPDPVLVARATMRVER